MFGMTVNELANFILSFGTFLSGVSGIFAVLMYFENRRIREDQIKPEIIVMIQPDETEIDYIHMIILNVGMSTAKEIHFEINPDFDCGDGRHLSEIGIIKRGLKYLVPNQKYQFYLARVSDSNDQKLNTQLDIKVVYKNINDKPYKNEFCIDLLSLENIIGPVRPPIYHISENTKKIADDLHKLVNINTELKPLHEIF